MSRHLDKTMQFAWRCSRNILCAVPAARRMFHPPEALAASFGPGHAQYAWSVYGHHLRQLGAVGFSDATSVLEVGPGRNLGTALLWWSRGAARAVRCPSVVLWDVFPNSDPSAPGFWQEVATALLNGRDGTDDGPCQDDHDDQQCELLRRVSTGEITPSIDYRVCGLRDLLRVLPSGSFDLIYSHAALEHVWDIDACLAALAELSRPEGGWHSHRVDLADHGRRASNYIEMLEWSWTAWWLTMRFVPGAINRLRAHEFESELAGLGVRGVVSEPGTARAASDSAPSTGRKIPRAARCRIADNCHRSRRADVGAHCRTVP